MESERSQDWLGFKVQSEFAAQQSAAFPAQEFFALPEGESFGIEWFGVPSWMEVFVHGDSIGAAATVGARRNVRGRRQLRGARKWGRTVGPTDRIGGGGGWQTGSARPAVTPYRAVAMRMARWLRWGSKWEATVGAMPARRSPVLMVLTSLRISWSVQPRARFLMESSAR